MRARFGVGMLLLAAASASAEPKGPDPHLQKLVEVIRGTWSITETSVPRPGAPAAATRSGTEVWHTATGGMTLIEENQTKVEDGYAHDTAVIWWDGKAQGLRGIWCADINSEGCSNFTVSREGDNIVMVGEWVDEGGRHGWKEEFVFAGHDSFTQTLFVGPPGGDLERVSVIRARRVRE